MLDRITTHLTDVGSVLIGMPLNVSEKFYYLYVLTFIGLAYVSFRR